MNDQDIVENIPYLNRYALKLMRNTHDAEDLASMTILKALEDIRQHKRYIEKPKSWLARIMYFVFVREYCQKPKQLKRSCEGIPYDDRYIGEKPNQMVLYNLKELSVLIGGLELRDKEIVSDYVMGDSAAEISRNLEGYRSNIQTVRKVINNFKHDALQIMV